jgi:hypothetical protein
VVQLIVGGKVTKKLGATVSQVDVLRKAGANERDEPEGQDGQDDTP